MNYKTPMLLIVRIASLLLLLSSMDIQLLGQEQPHFSISGYIQTLIQSGTRGDYIKVGKITPTYNQPTTRIGIRRGRLATQATYRDFTARIELNATESKLSIFNIHTTYQPHWAQGLYIKGGLTTIDFGYELPYSSSKRAAFDRSHYMFDLFPGVIDMGLVIGYKGMLDKQRHWWLESTLSILAGNGDKGMIKNIPDLALRLALTRRDRHRQIAVGLSCYRGYLPTASGYYAFDSDKAIFRRGNMLRTYGAAFINTTLEHPHGQLILTAEGIMGVQPGWKDANYAVGSKSPAIVEDNTLVQRHFTASMTQVVERIKSIDVEIFGRYTYYNRNRYFDTTTKQDGKIDGLTLRTEGHSHQLSGGINYFLYHDHVRLSLHYDCYLRQQLDRQVTTDTHIVNDPIHMLTVGAQYKF